MCSQRYEEREASSSLSRFYVYFIYLQCSEATATVTAIRKIGKRTIKIRSKECYTLEIVK